MAWKLFSSLFFGKKSCTSPITASPDRGVYRNSFQIKYATFTFIIKVKDNEQMILNTNDVEYKWSRWSVVKMTTNPEMCCLLRALSHMLMVWSTLRASKCFSTFGTFQSFLNVMYRDAKRFIVFLVHLRNNILSPRARAHYFIRSVTNLVETNQFLHQ